MFDTINISEAPTNDNIGFTERNFTNTIALANYMHKALRNESASKTRFTSDSEEHGLELYHSTSN